ncbi:hypothetical protein IU433_28685 [Nocardia puris]|uniref:hypothetical protein n=1 Tax=Nocardia puris TaxID=208602 RepID=UPI001895D397|nr:hypothetical protein [Nocardia puris]MBF6213859.1 hypothetical protein [Nocardia puris]MBF6368498.1 hypothetical protein [Nocardia puris]MBF6462985.1 hypothetical protein [Nocardia puris]
MSQPGYRHQPIVVEPRDTAAYLAKMDLDVDDIANALAAGETVAGNITGFHPSTGAGLARWIYTVDRLPLDVGGQDVDLRVVEAG